MILSAAGGPRAEYHLVEIRLFSGADGEGRYSVELTVPGWRSFPSGLLQLDESRLVALQADPRAYGRALGEMLLTDEAIGPPYRETLVAFSARQEPLRFRLRIDPLALQTIVWERLITPIDGDWLPLAATAVTPFSRYVLAQNWDRPQPITQRPLRLLAVIASPANLVDYGLDPISDAERQILHTVLDALPDVTVTYLESGTGAPPTLNQIRAALADGYQIVHVLAHGATTDAGTALYLEDEVGQVAVTLADPLLDAFDLVQTPPALCFLAACESAARNRHDAFIPLGPALVERSGVSAVVAMTDLVGMMTARHFTDQFYARLLHHGLVDLAMNEARALVQDQWDWGAPVLFSRLEDNQLIDFPVGQPVAEIGSVAVTVDRALEHARRMDHGDRLVAELERLLAAFEASFRILVDFGTQFRAVSSDPTTFAAQFQSFYVSFKAYYDQETFVDEQQLLRQMLRLKAELLPKLRPLLDAATYRALETELEEIAVNRAGLIEGFGEYLEPMNGAVDEIQGLIARDDVAGAIARKLEFETQISPSLRRSKELLRMISAGIGAVQAA